MAENNKTLNPTGVDTDVHAHTHEHVHEHVHTHDGEEHSLSLIHIFPHMRASLQESVPLRR